MIRDCPGTRTCHVRPRSAAYALRGKPQPHYLLTYLLTYLLMRSKHAYVPTADFWSTQCNLICADIIWSLMYGLTKRLCNLRVGQLCCEVVQSKTQFSQGSAVTDSTGGGKINSGFVDVHSRIQQ